MMDPFATSPTLPPELLAALKKKAMEVSALKQAELGTQMERHLGDQTRPMGERVADYFAWAPSRLAGAVGDMGNFLGEMGQGKHLMQPDLMTPDEFSMALNMSGLIGPGGLGARAATGIERGTLGSAGGKPGPWEELGNWGYPESSTPGWFEAKPAPAPPPMPSGTQVKEFFYNNYNPDGINPPYPIGIKTLLEQRNAAMLEEFKNTMSGLPYEDVNKMFYEALDENTGFFQKGADDSLSQIDKDWNKHKGLANDDFLYGDVYDQIKNQYGKIPSPVLAKQGTVPKAPSGWESTDNFGGLYKDTPKVPAQPLSMEDEIGQIALKNVYALRDAEQEGFYTPERFKELGSIDFINGLLGDREVRRVQNEYLFPALRGAGNPFTKQMRTNYTGPDGKPEFYFAGMDQPEVASAYAKWHWDDWGNNIGASTPGGIYPMWLRMQNPAIMDFRAVGPAANRLLNEGGDWNIRKAAEKRGITTLDQFLDFADSDTPFDSRGYPIGFDGQSVEFANWLARKAGHDSTILHHMSDIGSSSLERRTGSPSQSQYIIFDPRQAKSRFAREFDPNNPDIMAAAGIPPELLGLGWQDEEKRK